MRRDAASEVEGCHAGGAEKMEATGESCGRRVGEWRCCTWDRHCDPPCDNGAGCLLALGQSSRYAGGGIVDHFRLESAIANILRRQRRVAVLQEAHCGSELSLARSVSLNLFSRPLVGVFGINMDRSDKPGHGRTSRFRSKRLCSEVIFLQPSHWPIISDACTLRTPIWTTATLWNRVGYAHNNCLLEIKSDFITWPWVPSGFMTVLQGMTHLRKGRRWFKGTRSSTASARAPSPRSTAPSTPSAPSSSPSRSSLTAAASSTRRWSRRSRCTRCSSTPTSSKCSEPTPTRTARGPRRGARPTLSSSNMLPVATSSTR
jgi:hypothetical protein